MPPGDRATACVRGGNDGAMHPAESRDLWHLIETVHAVGYFAPSCREANAELGFKGFWMGYFGTRAAPMGRVGAPVVTATFAGFDPAMVARSIPDAWDHVAPDDAVQGRATSAAGALREAMPDCEDLAESLLGVLDKAIEVCEAAGRPLFASNRDVTPFEDPVEDLWQMCTTLREHRGDGHVAVLTAEGVGGCESLLLALASRGEDSGPLRSARGWSDRDWVDALTTLRVAGVIAPGGADGSDAAPPSALGEQPAGDVDVESLLEGLQLTERGATLHAHLEERTDDLASAPYAAIGEGGREHLRDGLIPIASAVVEQGWIPFPNPIGLPQVV